MPWLNYVLKPAWDFIFPPQIPKPPVVKSSSDHLRLLYVYVTCSKDFRKQIGINLISSADRNQISETSSQYEVSGVYKIVAVSLLLSILWLSRNQILSLIKSAVSKIKSAGSNVISKMGCLCSRQLQVRLDLQGVDDVNVKKELKKIGVTATNSSNDVVPIIVVRYHGFRIDSDVAESLQGLTMDEIQRTILIILHRSEERARDLHGKVIDPMMIPFSETETPRYRDYRTLKGIIHIDTGPEKRDIFKNKNCKQKIKDWKNEIESELI